MGWSRAITLLGRKFTLVTDHAPLQWMARAKDTNARVTRWFLALQDFHFVVQHRAGAANSNADVLPGFGQLLQVCRGSLPPTPCVSPTNTILFCQARTTLRGGGSVTSVLSPHQRCPGNSRGAPAHKSSQADRAHLQLINLPAYKQRARRRGGRSLSMRQQTNVLSLSHSRKQCVTDQHRHDHRTDSPAPGHDRGHSCKQEHHHHSCIHLSFNKIHPLGP